MTSEIDRWAASVAASCPLSPRAVLKLKPNTAALEQIEHRLRDTLGIMGIIEDGGMRYLGITARKYAVLSTNLNGLASRAVNALGIESNGAVPHGHIYAVDNDLQPIEDWKTIRAGADDLLFCRLFRVRG